MFHFSPHNRTRFTRLCAGLVLMTFGAFSVGGFLPPALFLLVMGFAVAVYQGVQMWRERPDPYDLSRLWDEATVPDTLDEDAPTAPDRTLIYCRNCGVSMPATHSICPQCGHILGM